MEVTTLALDAQMFLRLVLMSIATTLLVFLLLRFGPRSGLSQPQTDTTTSSKEKSE